MNDQQALCSLARPPTNLLENNIATTPSQPGQDGMDALEIGWIVTIPRGGLPCPVKILINKASMVGS